MSKKQKDPNFVIKPLISIKEHPPGFMFSMAGKSLNKNQKTLGFLKIPKSEDPNRTTPIGIS